MVRTVEAITLYFKEGRSDKQYVLELVNSGPELRGQGWSVLFAFGRRGSNFQSGRKVSDVSEGVARQEFCRLLEAKLGKGYRTEAVSVRGPSINGILARYTPAAPRFDRAAAAIVRTSTPRTPRQGAASEAFRQVAQSVRAAKPKPPAPAEAPATPEIDPFAPVKRKIKLG